MPRFTMPRDIYYGRGCIELLARIRGKRTMLVSAGGEMKRQGFLQRVEAELRRTGMEIRTHESAWPEEPERTVQEGAAALRAFEPDWIAAIGSAGIDAAKLMWILYEYPEATLRDLRAPFSLPGLRRKARFAAIPALDGAAPGVTAFAEIGGAAAQSAWMAADYDIVPDAAWIDPELSAPLQPEAVAEAGLEMLAYSIGALTARHCSAFAESFAEKAAVLVLHGLSAAHAGDGAAQEGLHYAQCLAGIAFSNAQAGLPHAFARQITGMFPRFRVGRGAVSGALLPHVIRFNAEDAEACARYARFAQRLGFRSRGEMQAALMLADEVEALCRSLALPGTLYALGLPEAEFEAHVRAVAARVSADFCAKENLRAVPDGAAEKILRDAFGQ